MSTEPLRIAMWSGPRNISTAMMRAFENRPDTSVVDEPFYAAYLAATGLNHPMREEVLRSQATDWRKVVPMLIGPSPGGAPIFYQKHMTHHMLPGVGTDWMSSCCNVFLIRKPDEVIASFRAKHDELSLADIGIVRQAELFEQEADRLGRAPIVVDAADVSFAPEATLRALCAAIGIGFSEKMLSWPTGRRASDGVWAPVWYDQVERSTGFIAKNPDAPAILSADLASIAERARSYYERLARWKTAGAGFEHKNRLGGPTE